MQSNPTCISGYKINDFKNTILVIVYKMLIQLVLFNIEAIIELRRYRDTEHILYDRIFHVFIKKSSK